MSTTVFPYSTFHEQTLYEVKSSLCVSPCCCHVISVCVGELGWRSSCPSFRLGIPTWTAVPLPCTCRRSFFSRGPSTIKRTINHPLSPMTLHVRGKLTFRANANGYNNNSLPAWPFLKSRCKCTEANVTLPSVSAPFLSLYQPTMCRYHHFMHCNRTQQQYVSDKWSFTCNTYEFKRKSSILQLLEAI